LAKKKYIIRHDKFFTHLHYSVFKKLRTETAENWHSHISKAVCEHEDISVVWDEGVQTDRQTDRFWPTGQTHAFSTSVLDGGEWSASCPGRFTPRERAPSTH
jgi:hypothetical protein